MINEQTLRGLQALGPNGKKATVNALARSADRVLAEYDITTPLRIAHFWAQTSHECAGFKTMHEYWGPTEAQKRYEGRRDLGNTQPGDGKRFMGRGLIQITGRANYREFGRKIGVDLEADPEKAANPTTALRIACEYWQARGLNKWADANDIKAITKRINGGYNGLADRKANFIIAWRVWGGPGERPAPGRTLAASTEVRATGAAAAGGGVGLLGAYEAGKTAISHVDEAKSAADNAAVLFGLSGSMALLIGGVVLLAAGCGYLLWRRWRRLKDEEM